MLRSSGRSALLAVAEHGLDVQPSQQGTGQAEPHTATLPGAVSLGSSSPRLGLP